MTGFNHFDQISEALDMALVQVVKKAAFDGQAHIQGQIRSNGQIDTGFMLNSVYVRTADSSTYGQAGSPPKDAALLSEVDAPPDNKTAYIAVGANYAAFQNYGTKYQPGRPFFEPGIDATRPGFEAALSKIEDAFKAAP